MSIKSLLDNPEPKLKGQTRPTQKRSPSFSWRSLIRPLLLAALGLHAVLLFVPLPQEEKLKVPDDKKNPIKVIQIPTEKPKTASKPGTSSPKLDVDVTSTPLPPDQPPSAPSTASDSSQSSSSSDSGKSASSASGSSVSANPPATTLPPPVVQLDTFDLFPHYQPSTSDCYGLGYGDNCRIVSSTSIEGVTDYFLKTLPGQQFSVEMKANEGAKRIFQVSKNGESRYLSLHSVGQDVTYLLANVPYEISPSHVEQLATKPDAQSAIRELSRLLDQALSDRSVTPRPPVDANHKDFSSPNVFIKPNPDPGAPLELQPGIKFSPKVIADKAPDEVYTALEPELKKTTETLKLGAFAGGNLYEIRRGDSVAYLNLVPIKTGKGTIVVVWEKNPSPFKQPQT